MQDTSATGLDNRYLWAEVQLVVLGDATAATHGQRAISQADYLLLGNHQQQDRQRATHRVALKFGTLREANHDWDAASYVSHVVTQCQIADQQQLPRSKVSKSLGTDQVSVQVQCWRQPRLPYKAFTSQSLQLHLVRCCCAPCGVTGGHPSCPCDLLLLAVLWLCDVVSIHISRHPHWLC